MQQMIDEDGNLWTIGADGAPVFSGRAPPQAPAQQSGPAPFTVGTPRAPEPKAPPSGYQWTPGGLAPIPGGPATQQPRLPEGYMMGPDGVAVPIPGLPQPQGARGLITAKERADAIAGYQSADRLEEIAGNIEKQYRQGVGKTGGLAGIFDYLPTGDNRKFDSTGNQSRGIIKQALGFTGGEGNTATESQTNYGPYIPQASDFDTDIEGKIQALRDLAKQARTRSVAILGGAPDANGRITPVDPMQGATVLPQAAGAQADPGMGPMGATAEGGLRFEKGLAGLPDAVAQMIGQGASASEVTAFLNEQYAPFGASVGPDLAGTIGGVIQKHRANPRAPIKSLGSGWDNFSMLPANQETTMLGRAADTSVGNAVMHGANAATFGVPAYMAGDQGAAVMDATQQSRPGSSMTGEIVGGTAAMLATGGIGNAAAQSGNAALRLGGQALTRGGGIGGDMLYGATRGGLENGPMGALTGALAAGAGNKVGGGIASTSGRLVRGIADPAVNALAERGIPMSLGSLLGNRSIPGKLMNRFESAPVIGDMFAARRAESIDAFNREAFKDAVSPLGGSVTKPGREGMGQALDIIDEGYRNALGDTAIDATDPGFTDAMATARGRMEGIPTIGNELSYNYDNNVAPLFEGGINGERLQAALRGLREMQAGYAGQPMGQAARDAVGEAEGALRGLVGTQRPDVLPKLDAANAAYRNVSTLADAVNTATNNKGIFTPAQLGRSAVNNTKKYGGRMKAASGDVPFAKLQEAAQEVLPSTYPDSGTAGRLLSAGLPTALGGGTIAAGTLLDPTTATVMATLAALSSKSGAKVTQKALTGRGATARAVGNKLINSRRKAGLFGAAAGLSMLPNGSQ